MTSKPSKDIFIAFGVLMLTIILSKEVNGASFIERQLACALDNGPCDKFGQEVKDALPEIIGNNCSVCNRNQLIRARRIAEFLRENYPLQWELLLKKYSRDNRGQQEYRDY